MERLGELLESVPDGEREEALQYYNDYFDDAGEENEESVIQELGCPEQVALRIEAELSEADSEYSERGYEDVRFRDAQELVSHSQSSTANNGANNTQTDWNNDSNGAQSSWNNAPQPNRTSQPEAKKPINIWKIVAIVLLCIFAAPIIIPLCIAAIVVVAALIISVVAVCFGIVVAGFAILFAGIVVIGVGLAKLFVAPAIGLAVGGVGFLLFALGVLLSLVTLWCAVKVVPWVIRGIVSLIRRLVGKAGAKE